MKFLRWITGYYNRPIKNKDAYPDIKPHLKGTGRSQTHLWNNPLGVLVAIREGNAKDWESLCRLCHCPIVGGYTDTIMLKMHISSLLRVGLLTLKSAAEEEKATNSYSEKDIFKSELVVTDLVKDLQIALKISLREISELDCYSTMIIRPRFGRPSKNTHPLDIFVLMPFNETMEPIYKNHIKKIATQLGLSVNRADNFFTNQSIVDDIWEAINAASVMIADCTGRNPNVFYEIGMAHVLGKPVILITQKKEDIPFDIGHLRYIHYEFTPKGMINFEAELTKAIGSIIVNRDNNI
jgi:hypothetical protein